MLVSGRVASWHPPGKEHMPLPASTFENDVPFPKVGYVRSLENKLVQNRGGLEGFMINWIYVQKL